MAYFDNEKRQWVLEQGDLAYWVDEENGTVARCKVELITEVHVYVTFTANDHGWTEGAVTREARFNRKLAPRAADRVVRVDYRQRLKAPVRWESISIRSPQRER